MIDQADVDSWTHIIARAYAEGCCPHLAVADEPWLARTLNTPMANCLMLAIPPAEWGPDFINIEIERWEAMARRRAGPRLQAVNFGAGSVTMR